MEFLNTAGVNYAIEEMIRKAQKQIVLVTPYLRLNARLHQLLEHSPAQKWVLYGKKELHAQEVGKLKTIPQLATRFCENLHAKCYMNERNCVITSLNLYEFSQVNNNEFGVLFSRAGEKEAFERVHSEVKSLWKMSVRVDLDEFVEKLSTSQLAKRLRTSTKELKNRLIERGFLALEDGKDVLTDAGRNAGGEKRFNRGVYFIWPADLFA